MCFAPQPRAFFHLSVTQSHKILEKHSVSRFFYLFAHLGRLSADSFSSDSFSSLAVPTSAASSVHKLPSITYVRGQSEMIHVDHYTPFKFKACLFLKCILSILYGILKQKLEAKRYLEDCSRSVLFDDALQHVEHLEELWARKLCPCKVTIEGPHHQTCSLLPFCHQSSDGSWDTEQPPAQIWLPLLVRPHDTTYTLAALSRIAPDRWVQRSAKP